MNISGLESIRGGYTIFYHAFDNCTNLTSITFENLSEVNGAFSNGVWATAFTTCHDIELHFPKLGILVNTNTSSTSGHFNGCSKITKIFFDSLTNINHNGMFTGCTNLTEIHFKNDPTVQSYIESNSGYATKWGCPNANCQIFFDL